jgi:hypothetical protein
MPLHLHHQRQQQLQHQGRNKESEEEEDEEEINVQVRKKPRLSKKTILLDRVMKTGNQGPDSTKLTSAVNFGAAKLGYQRCCLG